MHFKFNGVKSGTMTVFDSIQQLFADEAAIEHNERVARKQEFEHETQCEHPDDLAEEDRRNYEAWLLEQA